MELVTCGNDENVKTNENLVYSTDLQPMMYMPPAVPPWFHEMKQTDPVRKSGDNEETKGHFTSTESQGTLASSIPSFIGIPKSAGISMPSICNMPSLVGLIDFYCTLKKMQVSPIALASSFKEDSMKGSFEKIYFQPKLQKYSSLTEICLPTLDDIVSFDKNDIKESFCTAQNTMLEYPDSLKEDTMKNGIGDFLNFLDTKLECIVQYIGSREESAKSPAPSNDDNYGDCLQCVLYFQWLQVLGQKPQQGDCTTCRSWIESLFAFQNFYLKDAIVFDKHINKSKVEFECRMCDVRFVVPPQILAELNDQNSSSGSFRKHKCDHCGENFTNCTAFASHVAMCKSQKCICIERFAGERKLAVPLKISELHAAQKIDDIGAEAGAHFTYPYHYKTCVGVKKHLDEHKSPETNHYCELLDYDKAVLLDFLAIHPAINYSNLATQEKKTYKCSICDACFGSSDKRDLHEEDHEDYNEISFDLNKTVFQSEESIKGYSNLDKQDEKPYNSRICDSRFDSNNRHFMHEEDYENHKELSFAVNKTRFDSAVVPD